MKAIFQHQQDMAGIILIPETETEVDMLAYANGRNKFIMSPIQVPGHPAMCFLFSVGTKEVQVLHPSPEAIQ